MDLAVPIALLVVFLVLLALHVRIVQDDERLIVHRLGRFHELRGPGVVLKLQVETAAPLALGARGEALDPGRARFGSSEAPIRSSDRIDTGAVVRVVGFARGYAEVVLDRDQTRSFVCAKCGHPNVL